MRAWTVRAPPTPTLLAPAGVPYVCDRCSLGSSGMVAMRRVLLTAASVFACTGVTWSGAGGGPRLHVDQVGYLPDGPKVAVVGAATTVPDFSVHRADDDRVVFRGRLSPARYDASSGDTTRLADFSSLTAPGEYYVEVGGLGRSYAFRIAPDVYAHTFYLAMRAFYGQRCGTAVDLGPEFPGYRHAVCHLQGAWHPSSGRAGPRASYHGWHDAGDYGRYIVNSGATVGTLLWTFDLYRDRLAGVDLHIPESGNATPDLLDEVHWNLDWMLTMQDGDGGVWQKQTVAEGTGFIMPEQETAASVVVGTDAPPYKSSCATADFAASLALASRIYRPYDRAFSAKTVSAARAAWTWVSANPNVLFLKNPPGVAWGFYPDTSCADERLWAAAELWRTTGERPYRDYFLANYAQAIPSLAVAAPEPWNALGPVALWTYALADRPGRDPVVVRRIVAATVAASNAVASRTLSSPYRTSMLPADYVWGSNGVAGDYSFRLLVANRLHPDRRYVQAALENVHYILGRNPFSLSWVTQVGSNPFQHPHHRPSGGDDNPAPWPGLLSGGPNQNRQDADMAKLPPNTPPARMYLDDQPSYATNEIAINWQASLVAALAAALPAPAHPAAAARPAVAAPPRP